jgi:membrane associated rhomboid family serine protease
MSYRSSSRFAPISVLVLITINVVFFIGIRSNPDLVSTLALQPSTWTDEPWTLLTSIFAHYEIWHILANMITLFFFGRYLSMMVGDTRFLIVYFLGGIIGNFLVILLAPLSAQSEALFLGASGAIFAIAGVVTVLAPKMKVFVFPIPAPIPLWIAVIGMFIILTLLAPYFNIAWQAHLGGLLVGLAAGYFFKKRQRNMPVFR